MCTTPDCSASSPGARCFGTHGCVEQARWSRPHQCEVSKVYPGTLQWRSGRGRSLVPRRPHVLPTSWAVLLGYEHRMCLLHVSSWSMPVWRLAICTLQNHHRRGRRAGGRPRRHRAHCPPGRPRTGFHNVLSSGGHKRACSSLSITCSTES